MEIQLTDLSRDYLKRKKKAEITLDLPMRKFCCAGPYLPLVKLGKPKKEGYREVDIEDYKVYINDQVKYSRHVLTISVRKFLLTEELYCFDPDTICVCGGNVKNK